MVASTHQVTFTADRVVKRYRPSYHDEHRREWAALKLLHRYAPGLAPKPVELRPDDGPPAIVMTRLPGAALGHAPVTDDQVAAIGAALHRMHTAVPSKELSARPERRWGTVELTTALRSWLRRPREATTAEVEAAVRTATRWVDGPDATTFADARTQSAFTHADGNLANFLWDGERCSIVDFEDSGRSDPAYEVADLVEHVSVSLRGVLDPEQLVEAAGLTTEQTRRFSAYQRTFAAFWLYMLLPGRPAHRRNPSGSLDAQARHVLELLA